MTVRTGIVAVLLMLMSHSTQADEQQRLTIEWDQSTLRLIAAGGDYGRMARFGDGSIGCAYERAGKLYIRHSGDDGANWGEPILIAEESECVLTNVDLLPLRNGQLLCFWNERPRAAIAHQHKPAPPGKLTRPFLIRMSRSDDHGRTWSRPQTLYTAGPSYEDGCWEPAGIELPSAELHVYFANESPYRTSAEQEISLVRSRDAGKTWSAAETIAMRRNHRDGMPSPLLLADGRGIVVAIEDNGLSSTDRFKPAIVRTSLDDNWRSGPVDGDDPRRSSALSNPLDPQTYGGAPCLRQLPSGHTLLSYQESADGSLAGARMIVCIGDADARHFTNATMPLPNAEPAQLWNAMFVKNQDTITAISTATIDGQRGIWIIEGRVR